ncbi:MAG: hypothetical protein QNK11_06980, partial [Legionella sp.]|nr:hypothetical protein [Legionella sp.]
MFSNFYVTAKCESLGLPFSDKGFCNGVSLRWIEACLVGQEDMFNQHIKAIAFSRLDTSASLAFLTSVILYQHSNHYFALFNTVLTQSHSHIQSIAELASSDPIRKAGGLKRIYSSTFLYKQEALEQYISSLAEKLQASKSDIPVGVFLSSISSGHAIALTYTRNVGWKFLNSSDVDAKAFNLNEQNLL